MVHKRTLSAAESSSSSVTGFTRRRRALAQRAASSLPRRRPMKLLVIDKNAIGPYFVWLWAFTSDLDAAKKFLGHPHPESRRGSRDHRLRVADLPPGGDVRDALLRGDQQRPDENIRAYAALIETCVARIESALLGWPPVNPRGMRREPRRDGGPARLLGQPAGEGPANAAQRRSAAALWWIAGIAALGLGFALSREASMRALFLEALAKPIRGAARGRQEGRCRPRVGRVCAGG